MWMNRWEVEEARDRISHPVRGKAARFLYAFMQEVNEHSDGWAYWHAPSRAADQLMELIQGRIEATDANLRKAMTPIKSFYTRRGKAAGMKMPTLE